MTYSENLEKLRQAGVIDITLSFGCMIKSHHNRKPKTWSIEQFTSDVFISNWNKNYYYYSSPVDWERIWKPRYKSDAIEILWHPLTIGRVLWWIEKHFSTFRQLIKKWQVKWLFEDKYCIDERRYKIFSLRHNKDLPLDDQENREEIAEFLVSLIK